MKKYLTNRGFSLVEILISLITISLILAAFAPVISKRAARNVTVQEAKPECPQSWQMVVTIDNVNYCFTKFNVGDFVNGVGVDIPIIGINVVFAGEKCESQTDYSIKCCWKGNTSNQCENATQDYTYSGCTRSVCNWTAADAICKTLGMELPTTEQLEAIYLNSSKDKKSEGAQFCDSTSSVGALQCYYGTCLGVDGESCRPQTIWATQYDSTNANRIFVGDGNIESNFYNKANARSVRCISKL